MPGSESSCRFASYHADEIDRHQAGAKRILQGNTMRANRLLLIALSAMSTLAWTPFPAMAQITGEATQQGAQQNDKMTQAALQVALLVDQNKAGDVWDGASDVLKQREQRDAFVKQVTGDRKFLGALISRNVAKVSFVKSDGTKIPLGTYANGAFATRFANAAQTVRELVSFHLDSDQVWRVCGYTLR